MTNPIARLDVPLDVVEAAVARLAEQKRPMPEPAPPGLVAEYRHLLYDADPDATVPAFIDLRHHHTTRRGNR
ncbi:hypothetical protein K388_05051 [Streptomyces sp. KhCrAH-43]|uniref:hypothetical protein n=1 Tax=unclassified Streptomyces TaxID=2593676 RepID=UPI00035F2CEE|nr:MULTISPECIES: hypothetical protein [unclassified Streptomyces]MYX67317.1 hypothetical protein [Streptomyces sp. SID8373]RAJ54917.1 hypothetical protein K388_05051 [Streptomyces sp. KhCrAH-43]